MVASPHERRAVLTAALGFLQLREPLARPVLSRQLHPRIAVGGGLGQDSLEGRARCRVADAE
jgi:hypothetical protein